MFLFLFITLQLLRNIVPSLQCQQLPSNIELSNYFNTTYIDARNTTFGNITDDTFPPILFLRNIISWVPALILVACWFTSWFIIVGCRCSPYSIVRNRNFIVTTAVTKVAFAGLYFYQMTLLLCTNRTWAFHIVSMICLLGSIKYDTHIIYLWVRSENLDENVQIKI